MSLGVHFALASKDLKKLRKLSTPAEVVDFIAEDIEQRYLPTGTWTFESEKAWEPLHRCLTNGRLEQGKGPFPLAYAVLGGARLETGEGTTTCLVEPEEVKAASTALSTIPRDWLAARFRKLSESDYEGPLTEEELTTTWDTLVGLRGFFARAASADRAVLFSLDS